MGTLDVHADLGQLLAFFAPKIFWGLICGGIIGLERELKHKSAGIKTNMLICVGAVIYSAISVLISEVHAKQSGAFSDPGRVAAQIVSGIGFLGGGAIIQSRGTVHGLTTAATIWVVAALGTCIGLGYSMIAVCVALLVVVVLTLITFIEGRFMGRSHLYHCEITVDDPAGTIRKSVNDAIEENNLHLSDFDFGMNGDDSTMVIKYRGFVTDHKKFLMDLWCISGIKEVKQR
ncbi:MAG: MgtC/SapB family protein [Bacteriovoracia bacterium]